MADAFVRAELHERWPGDKPDYDKLHAEMEVIGGMRYMYESMKKVQLPTGMYRFTTIDSLRVLTLKVIGAAARTGHQSEGLLYRGEEKMSWGLKVLSTVPIPSGLPLPTSIPQPLAKLSEVGKPLPIPNVPVLKTDWENIFRLK